MKFVSVLKAPGGKAKAARDFVSMLPSHFLEYREPFCYSAGVFWEIPTDKRRWISDLNPPIAKVYEFLRDDPSAIDQILRLRDRVMRDSISREQEFIAAKHRFREHNDPLATILLSRHARFHLVMKSRLNVATLAFHASHSGGLQVLTRERLEQARAILQGTRITCCDYREALEADGKDVVLFLDPPYAGKAHAVYDYWQLDFPLLAERLRTTRHRFLLTVGNDALCRRLFCTGEFNVLERQFVGADYFESGGFSWHKELVVCNYPLPH